MTQSQRSIRNRQALNTNPGNITRLNNILQPTLKQRQIQRDRPRQILRHRQKLLTHPDRQRLSNHTQLIIRNPLTTLLNTKLHIRILPNLNQTSSNQLPTLKRKTLDQILQLLQIHSLILTRQPEISQRRNIIHRLNLTLNNLINSPNNLSI